MELNCKKCTLRLRSVSVIMQFLGYFTKLGFGDFANEVGASSASATGIVLSDRYCANSIALLVTVFR